MRHPDGTLPDFAHDGLGDVRTFCSPPPCFACGRHHEGIPLTFEETRTLLLRPMEDSNPRINMNLTVAELERLKASASESELEAACDAIKDARGGAYPFDWFPVMLASGLLSKIRSKWE